MAAGLGGAAPTAAPTATPAAADPTPNDPVAIEPRLRDEIWTAIDGDLTRVVTARGNQDDIAPTTQKSIAENAVKHRNDRRTACSARRPVRSRTTRRGSRTC